MDFVACEALVAALVEAADVMGRVQAGRDRSAETVMGSLEGPLAGFFATAAEHESELAARLVRCLREEAAGWEAAARREAELQMEFGAPTGPGGDAGPGFGLDPGMGGPR